MGSDGISELQLKSNLNGLKAVQKDADGKTIEFVFDGKFEDSDMDLLTSKAINTLVSSGAKITGVIQSRPTLEDIYLEIIAGDRKQN